MEGRGNAGPAGRRRFRDRLFEDPPESLWFRRQPLAVQVMLFGGLWGLVIVVLAVAGALVPSADITFRDLLSLATTALIIVGGFVLGHALRLDAEVRRLRARVAELEARDTADHQRPVR